MGSYNRPYTVCTYILKSILLTDILSTNVLLVWLNLINYNCYDKSHIEFTRGETSKHSQVITHVGSHRILGYSITVYFEPI